MVLDASLHLGGLVIQSQITTQFIPTQPKSNMKSVNIKEEIHVNYAVFRQVPGLVSQNSFKSQTTLDFLCICDNFYR